ncbi:MAG: C-terminal helicase domain-containing protein, partial [Planctomycetota bacterium]|nr:C-terminal helicase domain-containing protein [Planctomycetota bacterium]
LRRRRQEVLDELPVRADTRIDVPLTEPQREEHDAFLQPIAQLLGIAAKRPLTQGEFLKLMAMFTQQRIVSNGMAQYRFDHVWPGIEKARPEASLLEGLSTPKLAELRLLVQQVAIDQGRKVVVFSQWRRALDLAAWAVGETMERSGVRCAYFTGAESLRRRNENIVAFHDDPAVRVLFATDAGGIGLNLQKAASCCVHFDLPWNPAVFEQRVGRIWRLGQTEKVDVYSLVSEDCIESRMAEVLKGKQATFSAVFDGQSDEVRFERQGGFLATARRMAGGAVVAGGGAVQMEDAGDGGDEDLVPAVSAASAIEQGPPSTTAAAATSAEHEELAPARAGIDPARVRSLLAGLTVQPRADGGMVLQADRDAAAVLAEVLRGLAGAIEGAVGGRA